ncbi:response regulator [Oxalobacteraceae bacterium OM1]|nr:response regulator [Oxalobacteraceae bacterium OM1]
MDIPVKPRVLIADDSRIVRATLIKQIEGMFEFREALDGEEAWETLLIDPNIRVVITDLTMPKLDGYGLLQRIRGSKISRIRELPVVVVSGSDEAAERERAKAAGANDLITKGIGTAQLLSRLDVLAKLVTTQQDFERSLEALVRTGATSGGTQSVDGLRAHAEPLLAAALKHKRNFVVLDVCLGAKAPAAGFEVPATVVDVVGQLLYRTIRQTDFVAQSGPARFTLATASIGFESARAFAERVCRAIAAANLGGGQGMAVTAACGMASLVGEGLDQVSTSLQSMMDQAHVRAILGLEGGVTGVIGPQEEAMLEEGRKGKDRSDPAMPDLATLLQWIKDGRQEDVLPHIGRLSVELRPLVDLMLNQARH